MHGFLIEEIRNNVRHLSTLNRAVHFGWVKAHIGIGDNEAAYKLARGSPWREWPKRNIGQGAGSNCGHRNKQTMAHKMAEWMEQHRESSFVPIVLPSGGAGIKNKDNLTPESTAVIAGHGKAKSYLHRFEIADNPTWACNEGVQTRGHIIDECKILYSQRSSLIRHINARGGNWPPANDELVANSRI